MTDTLAHTEKRKIMTPFGWPAEAVEKLKELRRGYCSPRQIGEKLSRLFNADISRNAVMGKLYRLGLPAHAPSQNARIRRPARAGAKKRAEAQSIAKIPLDPIQDLPADESPFACTLAQLEAPSCRWPMGDPREASFRFCGAQKLQDGPYCLRHHQIAYRSKSEPRPVDKPVGKSRDINLKSMNLTRHWR